MKYNDLPPNLCQLPDIERVQVALDMLQLCQNYANYAAQALCSLDNPAWGQTTKIYDAIHRHWYKVEAVHRKLKQGAQQ